MTEVRKKQDKCKKKKKAADDKMGTQKRGASVSKKSLKTYLINFMIL